MWKSIVQIAGAIILAGWAAVGETQNILGVFNNSQSIVKWSPLIALFLLLLLVGWAWFDMRKTIKELEDKQPKVKLLSVPTGNWWYDWSYITSGQPEVKIHGIRISIHIDVQNSGWEATKINPSFVADDGKVFNLQEAQPSIPLEGRGTILNTEIVFYYPINFDFPKRGTKVTGLLKLEPWGEKTLISNVTCKDGNRADLTDEVTKNIDKNINKSELSK
jgi:hypothetical protein